MNWKLTAAALFFCAGAMATPAQEQVWGVRVRVPFTFEVASKKVPAGEYLLFTEHNEVYLREAKGNYLAIAQSNSVDHSGGSSGQVVFNCYGNECFLSQLWLPAAGQSRILLQSKSEKEAAKKETRQQFTLLGEAAKNRRGN